MKISLAAALLICLTSCTSVGPHPDLTVAKAEVKATKKVERLLVEPTTGTGTADPEADINKAVPAGAYARYQDNVLLASGFENTMGSLGMPKDVARLLPVAWETAFYRWVKDKGAKAGKRPKKAELHFEVPPAGKHIAKSDKDLQSLAKALEKRQRTLAAVGAAVESADPEELEAAATKAKKALVPVENLHRHLMARLKVTYVLVSHLDGDKEVFNKDEPLTLYVALVNAETGKFRYYARSQGKKSDLPVTYENLVGIMAHNVFADADGVDGIE